MEKPLRVLMVEDSEDDVLLMVRALKKGGYDPVYERVEDATAMRKALKKKTWDVILCDYQMPKFNGLAAIALLKKTGIDIPLIMVSGAIGEETAVECMKVGAQDYAMKGNLSRLVPAIERELKEAESRSKKKKAEEALRASEEKYRSLLDNASDAIFLADVEGNLQEANKKAEELLGYSREEISGINISRIHPAEVFGKIKDIFNEIITKGSGYVNDISVLRKDGTIIPVDITGSLIERDGTKVLQGIFRDITERKQAEEELRKSEERFRALFRGHDAIMLLIDQKTGAIRDANHAAARFYGYSTEQLCQMTIQEINTLPAEEIAHQRTLAIEEKRNYFIFPHRLASGEVKTVDVHSSPIIILGETILFSIIHDITDRRQAEETLKESENKYRLLADNIHDVIFVFDMNLNYTYVSPSIKTLRGYEPEEIMNKQTSFDALLTPSSRDLAMRTLSEVMELEKSEHEDINMSRTLDLELRRKDGITVWAEVKLSFIRDENQRAVSILGVSRDITERKRAEGKLQESEERFRKVFEEGHIGIAIATMSDGRLLRINRALCEMLGYTEEELKQLTFLHVTHPDHRSVDIEAVKDLQAGLIQAHKTEKRYLKKNGDVIWATRALTKFLGSDGKSSYALSMIEDITERKQAEEELKQAEERYRSIFDNAQEGIFRSIPEGRITMANQAMAKMFGYASPEEFITSITDTAHQIYVNPEERTKIKKIIEEQGSVRHYETQLRRKDGSTFWVSMTMQAVRDEKGQVLYYEGIDEDITERKENIERMRKALGATVQAIAVTVETRDPYTAGHQRRVADLSYAIATEMNLPADQIDGIRMTAAIHDLGKISVPAEILSKPTKLTNIEFSLIKTHSQFGYDILKDIDFPWPVARAVLEHHERMNGSGYPNGLTGDNLLLESRILAVADVVESMASHRPYRPSLGIEAALEEIEKNRGTLYDNSVADACLRIFLEKGFQLEET